MNEWALPATLAAGVGLGLVFAVAFLGWLGWHLFGRDAANMLAEAWRAKLSVVLKVAPPPLPPLDVSDPDHPAAVSARARMAEQWPSVDRGDLS